MNGLRAAVAFLTPLPIGRREVSASGAALLWFPVVGALLGLAAGALWWAADEVLAGAVAAGLAVVAGVALTGALHLDGLADSADGLLPHLDGRERRLAVMAAPDVGAFGVAAVVAALLLQWTAIASLGPEPLLLAGVWCASRTAMAVALRVGPYVGGGLGSPFLGEGSAALPLVAFAAAVVAIALLAGSVGATGLVALAAGALAAAGVVALARRRLGGVTGDVLGAAGVLFETAALVVATARW